MEAILFVNNVNLGRYAMFSETEVFMIGFIAGSLGAGTIVSITAFHYKQVMKDYTTARVLLKESIAFSKIQDDCTTLKMQVAALQSQFGVNHLD